MRSGSPWRRSPKTKRGSGSGWNPRGRRGLSSGCCRPPPWLEVLRDFVLFEPERGRLVKKLPRYQQYRAVGKALERIRSGGRPKERGGVIWHTQGSGKSLTAFWLATKLRRDPALGNATILVVTDRRQLDRQIAETFDRCGFPAPKPAKSGKHLAELLTEGRGRTVMTTIQKFEEALPAGERATAALDASDEVVVMVDEAHRTQYGTLGALLSQALPRAALIGFTGTPIDDGFRRSTMGRFGPLIDRYSIEQAVEDGATVEIRYEARLPELAVAGPNTLDRIFDAMFRDEPEEVREEIRRKYAGRESVAEASQRIRTIALDIADHFGKHIRPNGFKAQVVAPSRKAALRYREYLNDCGVKAYAVITVDRSDGPEFDAARDISEEEIVSAFKNPEGEPEVLVVVDKLLTGFDAPVEQALYLDHPLREHALLQAVARVNRRFRHDWNGAATEKTYGLVVDYCGVSANLEQALSAFSPADVRRAMLPNDEEDPAAVIEAAAVRAESRFEGRALDDPVGAALVFAGDSGSADGFRAESFERFEANCRTFARLMDRLLPDPRALAYRDRLARLTAIRQVVRAQYLREDAAANRAEIGAKVRRLLDEHIGAEVRGLMAPVSILAGDFEEKIAALPHDEARASLMEHAIRAEINERLAENRAYYEKLSEKLARIIRELREQVIDAAEAVRRLRELGGEVRSEADAARASGLTAFSYPVFQLLERTPLESGPGLVTGEVAPLVAGRLLPSHHRGGAVDVRRLPRLLLADELDLLVLLGPLAGEGAGDPGQLLFLRLGHQRDAAVVLRALLGELAPDVGELLLLGLRDQLDLPVPACLLQLQGLADLRRLAAPALLGGAHVALRPHAFERLLVVDLLLLHRHALVEHVPLLVADLLGLLVGDLPILVGARERLLLLDLQQLELGVQLALADGDGGALLGVVHLAPRVGGDLGDDLQALGVEHVVLVEELLGALLQGDDGDFFEREAVGVEALDHAPLHRLGEGVAVLVELAQGLGGREAAQRADDLGFEEVADLLGVEGALAEAARGGQQILFAPADVGVELRHHVDPDLVGGEHRLIARTADDELQGLQRDPGDLVEHRQDDRAAAQADLGAEVAGADEPHVGGRPLVDPDRDDVEDRDQDDHEEEEGNQEFRGHGRSVPVWCVRSVSRSVPAPLARSRDAPSPKEPASPESKAVWRIIPRRFARCFVVSHPRSLRQNDEDSSVNRHLVPAMPGRAGG